jgi:hypothetical protein
MSFNCTHGGDCRIHPWAKGLHNFDTPPVLPPMPLRVAIMIRTKHTPAGRVRRGWLVYQPDPQTKQNRLITFVDYGDFPSLEAAFHGAIELCMLDVTVAEYNRARRLGLRAESRAS